MRDDRARPDNRAVADGDALEDDGAAANPHAVADADWPAHGHAVANAVLVGIHDDDIPANFAVAANAHRAGGDNLGIAIEVCAIANGDLPAGPAFHAHA